MGNKTTRKGKLNKKRVETRTELAQHAKKLSDQDLKKYFSMAIPIYLMQFTALLMMLLVSKDTGASVGIGFVCFNTFLTLTYFVVVDGLPAWKMRKNSKQLQKELTPNQIKVFYAALKTRVIIRTPFNVLMTLITLVTTLVVFVI